MFIVIWVLLVFCNGLEAQFPRPFMGGGGGGYPQPYGMQQVDSEDEPDSGNWYEKLRWWKEAKRVYSEDIHDAMDQVRALAEAFEEKKKNLYGQLTAYYGSIPVERVAAVQIINGLVEESRKELEALPQGKEAQLKKEERERIVQLEDQIKKLESLKEHFEQFNSMVTRFHEAYDEVFAQQMRECDSYDERALENYERIEKVLDDEKAHHYYDVVENSLENIRAVIQYLRGPFSLFIDQAWAKIQELMPKIKTSISELDTQGVYVRVLTEKEKAEQEALKKKKELERKEAEEARKAEAERQTWPWWKKLFSAIGSFFSAIGRSIKGAFAWIGGLFSRSPAPAGTDKEKVVKLGITPESKSPSPQKPQQPASTTLPPAIQKSLQIQ